MHPNSTGVEAGIQASPLRPSATRPVRVTELVELAGDASLTGLGGGEPAGAVTGVTLRANQVRPGDLFAALPGSKVHGADFAADALAAGAAAILTDPAGAGRIGDQHGNAVPVLVHADPRGVLGRLAARIYGDPSTRLAVIGVTGTSGKTTTSYLIEAGLSGCGLVTGLIGTVQTRIAGHRLASAFTTPEAPDLQALLALMVERGVTHVAMEVSSHALALGRVDGTRFAVGAFSNLSPEHLDFHRDMEDYFATKARLFDGRSATEVVCVDTEWGRRLVTESTITVSGRRPDQSDTAGRRPDQSDTATTSGQADWWVGDIDVSPTGAQAYTVHGPDGLRLAIGSRLPGRFNAANTALALACVHAAGADVRRAVPAMAEVDVAGRMERVHRGQEFVAIVDYAHKPAAVAAVLDAVRDQHPAARLAIVVGCGGDRDRAKRPVMGAEAASRADLLVVTDDNPRSEDPALIRAAMLAGALDVPPGQRAEVVEIGDRRKAIKAAVDWAQPGDIIVIAGKGHETGQEIRGVKYPFSDREELAGAIDERLAPRGPRGD